ncbi:MAG: UDP-N-acetylmuramoyl-tripeptide--D-alanyl-D-alanine ligase [Woeseia sp.]
MIESTLMQAANTLQANLRGADAAFRGVSTDTRSLSSGELFVALQGPNFDGAVFASKAEEAGAAGIVVQTDVDTSLPSIKVDNARMALGRLAAEWRAQLPTTVIGVTGSNGKTTLKELIASCLNPVSSTLATQGNLNNDIGLPLMLLRLSGEHRFAVLEMGANHAGEIAYLTSLAMPSIVVISNAGPAHLEGFGSIDGVAHAKGEILQGSPRPVTAVLNADDQYFDLWSTMADDLAIVSFGYSESATVRVLNVKSGAESSAFDLQLPGARISVELPLPGAHNILNACAAAAVVHAAGLTPAQIRNGLQSARPVEGRLRPVAGVRGLRLFDDTYNANPASVVAAAKYIAAQDGTSWMVLGDMGELGADAINMHRAVGEEIRKAGVARLLATGELSQHAVDAFGINGAWYDSVESLIAELQASANGAANVLVKGSRTMRMERVVTALRSDSEAAGRH